MDIGADVTKPSHRARDVNAYPKWSILTSTASENRLASVA